MDDKSINTDQSVKEPPMAQTRKPTQEDTFEMDERGVEAPMEPDQFPDEFAQDTPEAFDEAQLDDVSLDSMEGRDAEELRKINPPAGEWVKEDEWQFKAFTNGQDCLPGDLNPAGRTLLTFMGRPKVRVVEGVDYDPVLSLRISPDVRYKQDEPDKVDSAYKLWLQAKEVYLALKGAKPKTLGDITKMLRFDEYTVRTMRGDSGPFILDLRAKRTGRGQSRS